jgi:hypothetical protein
MVRDTEGKRKAQEIEYYVRCPQSFAERYINAHTNFNQLDERRESLGRAIAGAYGDQGNLAVEIESPHGWLVLYNMPATVSSAHATSPYFRVTIARRYGSNAGNADNAGNAVVAEEEE